jgi:TPR repeat protein
LTPAVVSKAVNHVRLLFAAALLLGLREADAGALRFKGFPSRQRVIVQAVPISSEPAAKLSPPVAPGMGKADLTPQTNSALKAAAVEPKPPVVAAKPTGPDDAQKAKIKSERERLNHNAFLWQETRSAQGSAIATRSLAMRYLTGDGVEKDETKGMNLLRKAAADGDSAAQKELAKRERSTKE